MFKFPSTPHIFNNTNIDIRNDKIMPHSESEDMLSNKIIIEEKIDGANLGISFDENGDLILQNRGKILTSPMTGQWIGISNWINERVDCLFDTISNRFIIFGEWCFAKHSIYYDKLPDFFLGFDIFDKKEKIFLNRKDRNILFKKCKITPVPLVAIGRFTPAEIHNMIITSAFSSEISEGVYIKQENEKSVIKRAKLVRENFIQNIEEHWSKKSIIKNKILYQNYE